MTPTLFLATCRVLVARGASAVYVSEPSPVRRAIAAKCGATAAFDPLEDDAVGLVREATGGRGVDIAIDCAGTQRTLDGAVESTRRKGRIVMVALWDKAVKPQVEMWVRHPGSSAPTCVVRHVGGSCRSDADSFLLPFGLSLLSLPAPQRRHSWARSAS